MRRSTAVELSLVERAQLRALSESRSVSGRQSMRARIVLLATDGVTNIEIARQLRLSPATVSLWRRRFALHGIQGIRREAPRIGRPPKATPEVVARVLQLVRQGPPSPSSRWTTRSLAEVLQLNHMLVHRILKGHHIALRAPWAAAAHRRPRVLDVVGLLAGRDVRAAVFAVGDPPMSAVAPPFLPSLDVPLAVSGAYLSNLSHARIDDLVPSLSRLEEALPRPRGGSSSAQDLLIFFRAIDTQEHESAELHVLLQQDPRTTPPCLAAFLLHHPRFRVHSSPTGTSWAESVSEWLRGWRSSEIHRTSYRRLDQCCSAIAASVEAPGRARDGFLWVSGPELPLSAAPPRPEGLAPFGRHPLPRTRPALPLPHGGPPEAAAAPARKVL